MYDHLAADLEKVNYKLDYYLTKAVKELRKVRQFPIWKWYEYKVPCSNNKYILYYYAENPSQIENPNKSFFVDMFFEKQRYVVKMVTGGYNHTPSSPMKLVRQIHAYTSHFLHRYNERFLKDDTLSSNDIACRFLSRNKDIMPITINEEINKNIEEYGEGAKQGFRVHDGICFTQSRLEGLFNEDDRENDVVDAMLFVYTTFMSEYQMTNNQRYAIDKEHMEKLIQSYVAFEKEAINGELKLKLDP
jgi:hypothetical protein